MARLFSVITGGGGSGSTEETTDDTTDTTDDTTTTTDDTGGVLAVFSARELRQLAIVINNPTVWVVAALTGFSIEVTAQLLTQKSAVAIIIDDYLFRTILLPIGAQLFTGGLNIVNEFIVALFGTDRQVGVFPGSRAGLVDVPFLIAQPIITALLTTGLTVFNTIDLFNRSFVNSLPGLGIAGPAVVNILFAAEMIVVGYGLWLLISLIPIVNVRGGLLALTALPRRVLRRLL